MPLPSAKRPCTPPRDTPAGAIGVFERNGERIEMLWSGASAWPTWSFPAPKGGFTWRHAVEMNRLIGPQISWPTPSAMKRQGWRLVEIKSALAPAQA